jgi:hypothetical protein
MTVAELLAKHPFDASKRPQDFPVGSPERLRAVPEPYREGLASLYLACEPRWIREGAAIRARELKRQHQLLAPASRADLDQPWNERGEKP